MRTLFTGLMGLLTFAAGVYALLCGLLYWRQESVIFFPVQNDASLRRQYEPQRIALPAAAATLEGWWMDNPRATTTAVILYFGGNAEDVLHTASLAAHFNARRLLVVNYRGYGRSSGEPGQDALYADALVIYDYAITSGVQPEQIVLMGRSLGSGMAAMLAAYREVGAAILVTPFDSLGAVAAEHYPIFPVRLLLRHPFPSTEWARSSHAPALFLAADHDVIIPPIHAHRLYDAWQGKKQFHLLTGKGHNDIEENPRYFELINEFLTNLSVNREAPT